MHLAPMPLKWFVRRHLVRMRKAKELWDASRTAAAEQGLSTFGLLQDLVALKMTYPIDIKGYF